MLIDQAKIQLAKDPRFRPLVENLNLDYHWRPGEQKAVYPALLNAIIGQQISTKAAESIKKRFFAAFGNEEFPKPEQILAHDLESLRGMGLSRQKASYVRNIAAYFQENKLLGFDWTNLSDEEIKKQLTAIKGVGQWTAEIILMFALNRGDVLPLGDLVIRNGMLRLYPLESEGRQQKKELVAIAEAWRPYRTLACFYLWTWKHRDYELRS